MSTNSSEPLVPNTIRSPVRHSFNDFLYTEIYIGTPQKANFHIDTGSSMTWVQGKECQTCFPVSIPNFDGKQSTTCRAMLANNPLCVLPATGLVPISRRMLMALPESEGLFGLEKFTLLSNQGQQAIPNVPYGLGLDNHVNFNDRYHGQPNPISESTGLGGSQPTNILQQLNQITLQRFSYCLPPQFESQPSLLHLGNDAEIRGGTNVFATPILGAPNDHYYVR
ncbi:unnamed protein product [Prunus armeniaca]|uniref:Peptidase A1 domain-containing protein n=1 Tax=Prunus armeniaca TaxID=36596 RepID=A0A6J5X776_PRUAR|nr:unnamed protein product [Prunus armeniaca]